MSQTISYKDWVEYSLGDMKLIGFVVDGGEGIHWFNTLDRLIEGRENLMVDEEDIKILPLELYKEDIESMIDLALQAGDKEWFNELSESLREIKQNLTARDEK